jgi:hypothetical protein
LGLSHYGLGICIKKSLKAKEEELWKLKYFTMQKYNLSKNSSKRNQRSVDPASRSNHFIPIRSKPIARISSSQGLRQIVKREPQKNCGGDWRC